MFKKQAFLRKQAALGDWKGKDLEECALVEHELALKNGSVRGCCMLINPLLLSDPSNSHHVDAACGSTLIP